MTDDRLLELLAAHHGPATPDAAFEDRLFEVLQGHLRRRRSSRLTLLLAAALVIVSLMGVAAVGAGILRLPIVDRAPVSSPIAMASATPATRVAAGRMLMSHSRHTASLLADGRVLVTGGWEGSGAEIFDGDSGSWTATSPVVERRDGHTATVLPDGTVLVVGGATTDMAPALASAEIYDPDRNSWTATGSMATGRAHHTATLLPDGRVLVAGGSNHITGGGSLASVETYDPATGRWTAGADMNQRRDRHTATLLVDGSVLVAGGNDTVGLGVHTGSATAELWDAARGTWTATEPMAGPREEHSAILVADGTVLVVGGSGADEHGHWFSPQAERLDPTTGAWTTVGPAFDSRPAVAALLDGRVLVSDRSAVRLYDPVDQQWTPAPALTDTRHGYTATLLADGSVLMAGGWEELAFQGPALFERYVPPAK